MGHEVDYEERILKAQEIFSHAGVAAWDFAKGMRTAANAISAGFMSANEIREAMDLSKLYVFKNKPTRSGWFNNY